MASGFADHTAATFAALLPNVQLNMALEAIEEECGGDPQYIVYALTSLIANRTWPDLFTHDLRAGAWHGGGLVSVAGPCWRGAAGAAGRCWR